MEQQMKLYIESYQSKIEELESLESENKELKIEISKLKDVNMKLTEDLSKTK